MASSKTKIPFTSSIPVGYIDESGTGAGPFNPLYTLADATGAPITAANPLPVTGGTGGASAIVAGENHIGEVGGNTAVAVATFTRPANTTAYAVGQLVANSTTAASVAPLQLTVARKAAGTGRLTRARFSTSNAAATNATFRIHLFKMLPTTTVGDGGTFAGATNGIAAIHIGSFDTTLDKAFSDGAKGYGVPGTGPYISFDAAAGSQLIYALIEARTAYTPTSGETITIAIEADRD